jgi:hypothetical protein
MRAIQLDCNLEHLVLEIGYAFTNEVGVALAENLDGQHNSAHDPLVLNYFEFPRLRGI